MGRLTAARPNLSATLPARARPALTWNAEVDPQQRSGAHNKPCCTFSVYLGRTPIISGPRGRLWLFGGDAAVYRVDHGGAAVAIALVAADLSGGFLVPLADGLGDRFGAELVIA